MHAGTAILPDTHCKDTCLLGILAYLPIADQIITAGKDQHLPLQLLRAIGIGYARISSPLKACIKLLCDNDKLCPLLLQLTALAIGDATSSDDQNRYTLQRQLYTQTHISCFNASRIICRV